MLRFTQEAVMPKTAIIDNEFATLVYHSDTKIVHHTFHKPISGVEFRKVLNTGAETLQKYGASKWLSDDRGNIALPPDDTEWSKKDWFPRAVKAGWKFWALVVPQDIMARMNLKEFIDEYHEQGLVVKVFTTPDDALQWLRTA
jgi:hypothetical protein